jgi:hypothetical protein
MYCGVACEFVGDELGRPLGLPLGFSVGVSVKRSLGLSVGVGQQFVSPSAVQVSSGTPPEEKFVSTAAQLQQPAQVHDLSPTFT